MIIADLIGISGGIFHIYIKNCLHPFDGRQKMPKNIIETNEIDCRSDIMRLRWRNFKTFPIFNANVNENRPETVCGVGGRGGDRGEEGRKRGRERARWRGRGREGRRERKRGGEKEERRREGEIESGDELS